MAITAQALTVDPDQQAILKEMAARELRSPQMLLHEAVQLYLVKHLTAIEADTETDVRAGYDKSEAELLEESRASWEHYQRTGLHLTHEEVCAWAEQLKTDPNAKLPECHT